MITHNRNLKYFRGCKGCKHYLNHLIKSSQTGYLSFVNNTEMSAVGPEMKPNFQKVHR